MTSATERPESERVTAIITIVSVVVAGLFAIVVGEFWPLVCAAPLFLVLAFPYSLLGWVFGLPQVKWGVLREIWFFFTDIAVFLR